MTSKIDDTRIDACFQGITMRDQQALSKLFAMLSRRIYEFALGHVGNPATAEEVVTETFYEVWKSAGSFCGESKISTWIYGVARHKALDKLRNNKRRNRYEQGWDDSLENTPSHDSSAFDGVASRQSSDAMLKALDVLSEEQRECIHLVFYLELSLLEVAEIQGVPCNTVKTRLFHARRKLKLHLEREGRQTMFSETAATQQLNRGRGDYAKVTALNSYVRFE